MTRIARRIGTAIFVFAVLVTGACTSSEGPVGPSEQAVAGVSIESRPEATGRVVSAMAPGDGIRDARVEGTTIGAATSDEDGYFRVVASAQGTHSIRFASPSWVDRQTSMQVPGGHTDVSLIPGTFDLQFFNEMCRGFAGRLLRWKEAPVLVVERAVVEFTSHIATGERVPGELLDQTVEKLRLTLPVLSAGSFSDFASIERRTTAVGAAFAVPAGAIVLTWQRGLATGFGHVAYGARSTRGGPDLSAGEVALDADWHIRHLPTGSRTDYDLVLKHELGHALGYSHTVVRPSFMYDGFLMDVSAKDRDAFKIFFQRRSGNQAPDIDSPAISLSVMELAPTLVPIR